MAFFLNDKSAPGALSWTVVVTGAILRTLMRLPASVALICLVLIRVLTGVWTLVLLEAAPACPLVSLFDDIEGARSLVFIVGIVLSSEVSDRRMCSNALPYTCAVDWPSSGDDGELWELLQHKVPQALQPTLEKDKGKSQKVKVKNPWPWYLALERGQITKHKTILDTGYWILDTG